MLCLNGQKMKKYYLHFFTFQIIFFYFLGNIFQHFMQSFSTGYISLIVSFVNPLYSSFSPSYSIFLGLLCNIFSPLCNIFQPFRHPLDCIICSPFYAIICDIKQSFSAFKAIFFGQLGRPILSFRHPISAIWFG